MGELRPCLCRLQCPEGQSHAGAGQHETAQSSAPSGLEASVRRLVHPHRLVVTIPQRRLLERTSWKTRIEPPSPAKTT